MNKAVVIISGGADSSTAAAIAKNMGYELYGLHFHYHDNKETKVVRDIANALGFKSLKIIDIDWSELRPPEAGLGEEMRTVKDIAEGIPDTYSPGRNIIFLSYAASYAEVIGADAVVTGMVWEDSSGYPDCRPEFVSAFQDALKEGTKCGVEGNPVKILTPIIHMSKAEIVRRGTELGVPYELTWSCYANGDRPCLTCDSCLLRANGFYKAGLKDPLLTDEEWERQIEYLKRSGFIE